MVQYTLLCVVVPSGMFIHVLLLESLYCMVLQKFDEYPSKCEDLDEQIHLFHAKAELCSGIDPKVIEMHFNEWY